MDMNVDMHIPIDIMSCLSEAITAGQNTTKKNSNYASPAAVPSPNRSSRPGSNSGVIIHLKVGCRDREKKKKHSSPYAKAPMPPFWFDLNIQSLSFSCSWCNVAAFLPSATIRSPVPRHWDKWVFPPLHHLLYSFKCAGSPDASSADDTRAGWASSSAF